MISSIFQRFCFTMILLGPVAVAHATSCEFHQKPVPGLLGVTLRVKAAPANAVVRWQAYDLYGGPLDAGSVALQRQADQPTDVPITLTTKESPRAAIVRAVVLGEAGDVLASVEDFFAADPATLDRVPGSERFGVVAFPYIYDEAWQDRFFGLFAACGVRSLMAFEMDRCFDNERHTVEPQLMRPITDRLRRAGIDTLVSILAYAPVWASALDADRPEMEHRYAEPDRSVWLDLVQRYVAGSDFDAYQIWGEANGHGWSHQPRDQTYADFMVATARAVREVNPDAKIIGGNSNYGGPGWLVAVLKHAGADSLDYANYHPYRTGGSHFGVVPPERHTEFVASYPQIARSVDSALAELNGGKRLPVWITETGLEAPDEAYGVTLLTQAQYVPRCLLILAAEKVEKSLWFSFRDVADMKWGLVHKAPPFLVKPGWWALRTLNQFSADRSIGALHEWSDDVFAVELIGAEDHVVAVWSVDRPKVIRGDRPVAEAVDLIGQPLAPLGGPDGSVLVLPAGSDVYLRGDELGVDNLSLLADVRPVRDTATPGEPVLYEPILTDAGRELLGTLPDRVATLDRAEGDRFAWHYDALNLQTDVGAITVPVTLPVVAAFDVRLDPDDSGGVTVVCDNRGSQPVTAMIEATVAQHPKRSEQQVAPQASTTWSVPMDRSGLAAGQPVDVQVLAHGQRWSLQREAWFAAVPAVPRSTPAIVLTNWHATAGPKPEDPADLSGHMVMRSTDDGLEVIIDVRDNRHAQPYTGIDAWQGDSVQLAYSKVGGRTPKVFTFYKDGLGRPSFYCNDLNQPTDMMGLDISTLGDLTTYHITLPWSMLGIAGTPGDAISLATIINENDGNGREGYLRWADGIGDGDDPQKFGYVKCIGHD